MQTMNVETAKWRRSAVDGETVDPVALVERQRRRRTVAIAIAVIALLVAVVGYFGFAGGDDPAAAPAAAKGGRGKGGSATRVTVIVPGRTTVPRTITANGSLAARRDMPVGVAGEGGLVSRVLVEAGSWVGAGQTLAVIERSVQAQEAAQLAASIEVARADARLAQQELNRAQALVSRGFVSKADVERRVATRDAANARVRVAQAQLGASRARIGRLDIRAPAAGLVLDRNVEVGQVVSAGSGPLFRIARGGEMEMLAQLAQQDMQGMRVGLPVTVKPLGSDRTFNGSIWQISPIVDPQTRQGEVRIAIPYDPAIRPGGFADAEIRAGAADAPLLPQSAVLSDDRGNYVYIIDAKNEVVRRDVEVGSVSSAGVAIRSGLSGQERVVLSAGAFLNPGQKVIPTRAPAR